MNKPRLVIIEDDRPTFRALRLLLAETFEVHHVSKIADVKPLMDLVNPCVVILDLKLDDGNGSVLVPLIRNHYPGCGIVIMTGDVNVWNESNDYFDDHYVTLLTKPCLWDDLIGELTQYIPRIDTDAQTRTDSKLLANEDPA